MSLDGLRAWIGEVERKLGMRTRVFLVLLAIAIGGAGAAIYLAIEAENDSGLNADEVRAVVEEQTGGGSSQVSALESQVAELRGEVEALQAESKPSAAKPPESEAKPPEAKAKPPQNQIPESVAK
jgi:outer membrane murein-binding lipoprotein Lpp